MEKQKNIINPLDFHRIIMYNLFRVACDDV